MRLVCLMALFVGLSLAPTAAPAAADPDASSTTQAVLDYISGLASKADRRVISGQYLGGGTIDAINAIHDNTGKWLGLLGADYYPQVYQRKPVSYAVNADLIDYWNAGGLVTITVHIPNPNGGEIKRSATNVTDFVAVVTEGTDQNTAWRNELSGIADGLQQLQEAGVVVLFRPLHEMNDGWWWSTGNITWFGNLWVDMWDYMTTTRGLHNLLWVYSPGYISGYDPATVYPGSQYVDIIGQSRYTSSLDPTAIDNYGKYIDLHKPYGLGEYGPNTAASGNGPTPFDWHTLIVGIRDHFPLTSFFQAWAGSWGMDNTYNFGQQELLSDPWIVNRADICIPGVPAHTQGCVPPTGGPDAPSGLRVR